VLRTERADALFVWRVFIDDSGQSGVNCAVFRNESRHQSSQLIRQADQIADVLWPDSTELYYAHMEADRNKAEEAYFAARPAFRAGFERAYAPLWHRLQARAIRS
jgi:hypothetical protein